MLVSNVKYLVLDEADMLLEHNFVDDIRDVLNFDGFPNVMFGFDVLMAQKCFKFFRFNHRRKSVSRCCSVPRFVQKSNIYRQRY